MRAVIIKRPPSSRTKPQVPSHQRKSDAKRPRAQAPRVTLKSAEPGPGPRPACRGREPLRIAKAMARAGLCSRREAERWIEQGRVNVNGKVLTTPAFEVSGKDKVLVDGKPLPGAETAAAVALLQAARARDHAQPTRKGARRCSSPCRPRAAARHLRRPARFQQRGLAAARPTAARSLATWSCRRRDGCAAIACARMAACRKPISTS